MSPEAREIEYTKKSEKDLTRMQKQKVKDAGQTHKNMQWSFRFSYGVTGLRPSTNRSFFQLQKDMVKDAGISKNLNVN